MSLTDRQTGIYFVLLNLSLIYLSVRLYDVIIPYCNRMGNLTCSDYFLQFIQKFQSATMCMFINMLEANPLTS